MFLEYVTNYDEHNKSLLHEFIVDSVINFLILNNLNTKFICCLQDYSNYDMYVYKVRVLGWLV